MHPGDEMQIVSKSPCNEDIECPTWVRYRNKVNIRRWKIIKKYKKLTLKQYYNAMRTASAQREWNIKYSRQPTYKTLKYEIWKFNNTKKVKIATKTYTWI